MAKEKERKTKQVTFMVECAFDANHRFEKKIRILDPGTGEPPESQVDAYCPFCGKMNTVTIKGKPVLDKIIERKFREQEERLKKR
jgi:hypothetical protein